MSPACRGGSITTTPTTTSWRGSSPSNTRRGSASSCPGCSGWACSCPSGGTTLFLRRDALEEVGGWDAHNVTEDAELGLRLARAGYRAELVDTTTYEEATAAVGPWIRQRSRWLKGYIITWATAMRGPLALWRDLGTWRFMGLQAQMLTAVLGFFLAPLLWSLVVVPFGVPHPLTAYLEPQHFAGSAPT
jgi:cellulose synthase/poly-beta-1,6-N-acetylglucosamine synthase-like glycosyltransferase